MQRPIGIVALVLWTAATLASAAAACCWLRSPFGFNLWWRMIFATSNSERRSTGRTPSRTTSPPNNIAAAQHAAIYAGICDGMEARNPDCIC